MAPVSLPVLGVGLATCLAARAAPLVRLRRRATGERPRRSGSLRAQRKRTSHPSRTSAVAGARHRCGFLDRRARFSLGGRRLHRLDRHRASDGVHGRHRRAPPRTAPSRRPCRSRRCWSCSSAIVAVIHDQQSVRAARRRGSRVAARKANRPRCSSSTACSRPSATTCSSRRSTSIRCSRRYEAGTIDRAQFELLAVAINTGTNIPSVATPNGQAAFLFLLTSALAPLIRLSYMRMVIMALPYFVTMTATGLAAVVWWL